MTAAAELFRRQGYAATGIKAVLTAAEAPYGSLYHFFPGGKADLGRAVVEEGGRTYLELVEVFFPDDADPVEAVGAFFDGAADVLESTGFADACPIATIAGEIADTVEGMRVAAADAFAMWIAALARHLGAQGVDPDVAGDVAIELFCLVEGAFLLGRTSRSAEPLRVAGRRAQDTVAGALGGVRSGSGR